jgi:hypothetical protein
VQQSHGWSLIGVTKKTIVLVADFRRWVLISDTFNAENHSWRWKLAINLVLL